MTWVGIGHTPRGDDKHVYGSVHWTAGCDIEVRLVGSENGRTLNLMLETVKSNDGERNYKHAISLEFGPEPHDGLVRIKEIQATDPDLVSQSTDATFKVIKAIEGLGGQATTTQIADETGLPASNVNRMLRSPRGGFVLVSSSGKEQYYGMKTKEAYHDND
jgi:hypothetical protein